MEGRRSSAAALLLLALLLAAGSLAAVAQLSPPAGSCYMLVALHSGRGSDAKLAMRTGGGAPLPSFANGKNEWFAVTGSEDLVPPGSSSYGRANIAGLGLVNMLAALVNDGTR
ncbi:unnamed protein product [Urochloa decumbens]|uniref:Uncharacterized protein n=1 Tax=Urochloa decumbens TaxID=240449 RepID=A0ABC9DBY5_9POAL